MSPELHMVIRTPHQVVLDARVSAARVPAATGQVGLRPRQEPLALVALPGLILLRSGETMRFAASAGGLLDATRDGAVLYTPFAVAGDRDDEVLEALERALATPEGELAARRRLEELERRIAGELRRHPGGPRRRGERG